MFDALAWGFYRAGIRPIHLTFLQAPVYAAMVWVGWTAKWDPAYLLYFALLQILVVLLDGADGILARRTGTVTRQGHLLDSVFDVLGIGVTLWVVFHIYPELSQWVILLLLVNFLVYLQNEIQGTKSITYTRGPVTVGLYFDRWLPGLLLVGILLPLAVGLALMVTRVDWRRRLWNYYQFLTAGRRQEYKAVPRDARAQLGQGMPFQILPPTSYALARGKSTSKVPPRSRSRGAKKSRRPRSR